MRESVLFLLPIFLMFILMDVIAITLAIVPNLGNMPDLARQVGARREHSRRLHHREKDGAQRP